MFKSVAARSTLLSRGSMARRLLSTGDKLPNVQLRHQTPGDLFSLPTTGAHLVVGVPAAFSPGCSNKHIPGYLEHAGALRKKGVERVFVLGVNDVFVMNAWRETLVGASEHGDLLTFLADHDGAWTRAADIGFDASSILGGHRTKRFAAVVRDGTVEQVFIEPDNTGITVSAAESVLAKL